MEDFSAFSILPAKKNNLKKLFNCLKKSQPVLGVDRNPQDYGTCN
jgi:hypothetical protein